MNRSGEGGAARGRRLREGDRAARGEARYVGQAGEKERGGGAE